MKLLIFGIVFNAPAPSIIGSFRCFHSFPWSNVLSRAFWNSHVSVWYREWCSICVGWILLSNCGNLHQQASKQNKSTDTSLYKMCPFEKKSPLKFFCWIIFGVLAGSFNYLCCYFNNSEKWNWEDVVLNRNS